MSVLTIIGCGGHARDVWAAWLEAQATSERDVAVNFWSEIPGDVAPNGQQLVPPEPGGRIHVAIGDNAARRRLYERRAETRWITVVDVDSVNRSRSRIGWGSYLAAGAVLGANAVVGAGVIVNYNASIGHDVILEHFAHVAPLANLCGKVRVGENAFIGASAVVLPGVSIGAGAIVGAGAVVQRDVPPGVTVYGNPARPMPGSGT